MMKGGMAESQAGCTIWGDVSKETFERFTQFAYTGDYSIPKMEKRNRVAMPEEAVTDDSSSDSLHRLRKARSKAREDPDLVVEEQEPELANDWDINLKGSSKKYQKVKGKSRNPFSYFPDESSAPPTDLDPEQETSPPITRVISPITRGTSPITRVTSPTTRGYKYPKPHWRLYSDDFQSLTFQLLAPRNNHDKTCEPAEHFDPNQSYTEVFLSHASLYILGDLQLIDSLKALALFKLHKTLCVFQLDDENAEDIVALARHAYSEEGGCGGLDRGVGDLRNLVCQYMATNALV
jgi:hypothetical protein